MNYKSSVEQHFFKQSGRKTPSTIVPYVVVPNFPKLGLFTALRFLEWVNENPSGVMSLPTGKTPEHFIKWTQFFLTNWSEPEAIKLREENGLFLTERPILQGLHFVQIDEFYPISPKQHNSFYSYVQKFYIQGFQLNPKNALLINCDEIPLANGLTFSEVFPNNNIDLSLRNREAKTPLELLQQQSIFKIDNWCTQYEEKIRVKGGIGFFLGGIGPDGHIAFNTRGSDHNSATRLTATNFETQAASAGDLGGIEVSRNRLVITIGLDTLTYNKEGVSIIFAAGEAKAPILKKALESPPDNLYPATVLQRQKNARFYITEGAGVLLKDSIDRYYTEGEWNFEKTERAIFELCEKINKYAHRLTIEDLKNDEYTRLIPNLSMDHVAKVVESTKEKIQRSLQKPTNQTYLHTGPHHDDIMLGIFPDVIRQLRDKSNKFHFAVLTSGFTAVTNNLIVELLTDTMHLLKLGKIEMVNYPDFFEKGYQYKWDKDVAHYLNKLADFDRKGMLRGICHRLVRAMVDIYGVKTLAELIAQIEKNITLIKKSYDGEKNTPDIQQLKGMLREFEEELVWAHYGVQVKNIEHLRLGFYTGDIFTQQPERKRDVEPILEMLRKVNPTVVSLALDPEGSGPDTHYKVMQATAEALRQWSKEYDCSKLSVVGYRNVWFKFQPSDANTFVPVSLNSMAVMDRSFKDCYISQVNASFPSPELDGPFSFVSQKVWVEQFKRVQLVLGKDFFYEHESPQMRATHGMIFYKNMNLNEFLTHARELEKSMEGILE
jgi:glucosamine-6-phosphate deaminase